MAKYAYFSPTDGLILCWIDTDAHSYNLPSQELLHTCTENEWAMQYKGVPLMVLNGAVTIFIKPETSLELRRSNVIGKVKERRKIMEKGGIEYNGLWFDSDADSVSKYETLLKVASTNQGALEIDNSPVMWKTMTGETILLTLSALTVILDEARKLPFKCYATYQSFVTTINMSEDPEQIDIETGWPITYLNK